VITIHKFINGIKKVMPLTMEESVTVFLGIKVKHEKETHVLLQPSLIKKVIEATGMMDCNLAKTPTATSPATANLQADPFNETWEYARIIGMLMLIANNTQPDIAYATIQCARFKHSPKTFTGFGN
jgi:hypothetical protein